MASSKEYLDFVLEQLCELEEITYRAMMGEYILYYRGKIIGGIYDDRLHFTNRSWLTSFSLVQVVHHTLHPKA